ncbi:MAG TPA: hypothetical protein VE178_08140 [Silvibacterium sp.]|nr:hypothetical protein [Silvibacterium sp.]
MIDKYVSREIRRNIRRVLLDVWDPIGVRDEPYAQDEYDAYLGDIYEILVGRASDDKLVEYLRWVAEDRMGFSHSPKDILDATVKALREIPIPESSDQTRN